MKRKIFLVLILISAGVIHLIMPIVFLPAIPVFIPFKENIIFYSGIFEIVMACALMFSSLQDLSAKIICCYFILLVPIHIYVSLFGIKIFGISSKLLLWARTFFQYFFIILTNSLQKKTWVIEQVWRHVFFIHYQIDPELLSPLVPFELDLYEGKAIVSVVPFLMEGIRFPFLPKIPKISSLWELNIRTYVEVNGIKGIYFFTLETDSKIGEIIAQKFFFLPYRFSKIKASVTNQEYKFFHQRDHFSLNLEALLSPIRINSEFSRWAYERYSLFTQNKNIIYQGIVVHKNWEIYSAKIIQYDDQFTKMLSSKIKNNLDPENVGYSRFLAVRFLPFKKIN